MYYANSYIYVRTQPRDLFNTVSFTRKFMLDIWHTIRYGIVMKTLSKTDWLKEGLAVLGDEGSTGITINNLCNRLEISKGSFYHHFKNVEEYIKELMIFWVEGNTLELIRLTNEQETETKRAKLHEITVTLDHRPELSIRAWSFTNPIVKEYVQKVDRIRFDYLIDIGLAEGLDAGRARQLALLCYSSLIGVQLLYPDALVEVFLELRPLYEKITESD